MFSCETGEIFRNKILKEHLQTTASEGKPLPGTDDTKSFWLLFTRGAFDIHSYFHHLVSSNNTFSQKGTFRKASRSQMFFKIGTLKNFAKFLGKPLSWSISLIKLCSCEFLAVAASFSAIRF